MKAVRFAGVLCVCLVLAVGTGAAADAPPKTLALGSEAPDFNLPGTDGKNYSLKDFANAKALVVIFTANHCPTAQYYEKRIKQIVTDYRDRGAALIAISPNDPNSVRLDELGWSDLSDSFAEMKIRARQAEFSFPYLYDGETEAASRLYGPVATPHAFVFDSNRKLRYVGAIDDSERVQHVKVHYVRDAVEAVLAGKEPPVTSTKVVGCSVKWAGKADAVKVYMEKLAAEPVTVSPVGPSELKKLKANNSGKFRLVTFWATWCAPCIVEFHEFVTINRMYRHRDFEVVSVSMNRPNESQAVFEFLTKQQASFRNLLFNSADRTALINAFKPDWQGEVPYTVLIDPEGKVIDEQSGSIDALALRRKIVAAMNEKKPW